MDGALFLHRGGCLQVVALPATLLSVRKLTNMHNMSTQHRTSTMIMP